MQKGPSRGLLVGLSVWGQLARDFMALSAVITFGA